MEIKTQQLKESKPTLKDEFQDLRLNLPVLKVLARALIYSAILDKYIESLELGQNGSAFVQREVPAKMEDPGLFTLPCRPGDSKPFDTLADLGSCVNIIPLYLFKKLNIGLLEETDHIFGRGFLATTKAVIDYRMATIVVGEGITGSESDDLIKNSINWDKPLKDRDRAWHAKIRLIDPDDEELTKTYSQSPLLESSPKEKVQGKSSTWTTSTTLNK
uniref:Reverse transcriptase domain-containing protein n=1 Tax=Tanacetum cinerariifolium TaxID=118510 RepID=A0A6L2LTQ6_TANCI|nr:hypothetical protein [Tanacetum cinerariifolium]